MTGRGPQRPKVLLGALTSDGRGSVASIMEVFRRGLADRYELIPHYANRKYGDTRLALFRPINLWYLVKHFVLWLARLVAFRPAIAHYPITSYWNLDKSLLFLGCARLLGAKTIGHLHGGAFLDSWKELPRLRKRIVGRSIRSLDALIVLSDGWKDQIVRAGIVAPDRAMVVHNPIDPAFEHAARAMDAGRGGSRMLAMGIMGEQKGVLDLLEAARRVLRPTGFSLDLVGPEREPGIAERCRSLIDGNGMGDIVRMNPGVWGEARHSLFAEASIFLLPSYYENFPLVVLEAAAAGMAMILTPVGASREFFVHGESALFVPPGDPAALGEAMRTLARRQDLRKSLGLTARRTYERHLSCASVLDSLDQVYQTVLRR